MKDWAAFVDLAKNYKVADLNEEAKCLQEGFPPNHSAPLFSFAFHLNIFSLQTQISRKKLSPTKKKSHSTQLCHTPHTWEAMLLLGDSRKAALSPLEFLMHKMHKFLEFMHTLNNSKCYFSQVIGGYTFTQN